MKSITRRRLGKSIAAGAAACLLPGSSEAFASLDAPHHEGKSVPWGLVAPGLWKARVGTPEEITPVSVRSVPPLQPAMQKLPHVSMSPMPQVLARVGPRGTSISIPLAAREEIYGFGLQFFSLKHRSKKRVIRVNADPRVDSGESHAPVPFYVSSLGYGILVDTARYVTFYCGEARPKPVEAVANQAGGVVPLYTKTLEETDTSEVIAEVPLAMGVDVYLFAGPSMLDVVRRYNCFSGGGVFPPEWGLGFWYRAQSNATDHEISELAAEFRERKIPCDVIGLEAGWHTHAYSCTFAWNRQRFPDPPAFIAGLKLRQYKVNVWEHAFTHPSSPLFGPMKDLAGDKAVWGGLVPDFLDPKARAVFGGYHGRELVDIGIDSFKLDECDNSDYTGGWSFPELTQFPSGADGEQMHNLFGLKYQQTLWSAYTDRRQPTYGLVRSSGALAAPYPFVLYSDLYNHRQFVRALVTSSFSGLLWCPEVRDASSEEDLLRRLQSAVFSPLAMINGWYIANPPWKQLNRARNNANDLTPDWQKLEARCREIIGWRMQLLPYLRSAFALYAEDGTPPFRALALDWPEDPEIAEIDDAWIVGDRLLVAPLFADEPGRTLLLPPGDWHDLWTGTRIAGGTKLEIPASHENAPAYVKTGSLLPLATIGQSTSDPESRNLRIQVFGDGSLPFRLHTGSQGATSLTWSPNSKQGASAGNLGDYRILGWDVRG